MLYALAPEGVFLWRGVTDREDLMMISDGNYLIDLTLEGGSGRASVVSPASLTVAGGEITASVEWSSAHYDLMIVDGARYLPVNTDGNSVFEIPVASFDEPLPVEAETTAMSEPHLIAYELVFDGDTLRPAGRPAGATGIPSLVWLIAGGAVLLGVVCAAVLRRKGKAEK